MKATKEKMPLVYICSPFSGDTRRNMKAARMYCRFAAAKGCVPIAPHLFFPQFMKEGTERELALSMDLRILERCDKLFVFGKRATSGMRAEIACAKKRKMPIRFITEDELCTK